MAEVSTSTATLGERSQQLSATLRQAIQRGDWEVGASLPTTRQIAREHNTSLNTVQDVLRDLESQGMIESRPRQRSIVTSRTPRRFDDQSVQQVAIITQVRPGEVWPGSTGPATTHELVSRLIQEGYQPITLHADTQSPDVIEGLVQRVQAMGDALVGLVIFNTPALHPLCPRLDEIGMPWVMINRPTAKQIHNFVAADNLVNCQLLGECFARSDRHRVLVLMPRGPNFSETEREKITGMIHGFFAAGAPIRGIDYMLDGPDQAMRPMVLEHLRHHGAPDAIFALSDGLASGAIAACNDMNLSVPADVAVVAGTGLDFAEHMRPPLTVITQPMAKKGEQACQMLIEMIRRNVRRIPRRRIRGRLILRESLPLPASLVRELDQRYPGMIQPHPDDPPSDERSTQAQPSLIPVHQ